MKNNTVRKMLALLVVLSMVFALTAFAGADSDAGGGGEKVKIGYCISSMEEPFALLVMQNVQKIVEERHPDWEFIVQEAKFDVNTELSVTESFIAQGCDIIAYHAVETLGSGASIEACNAAGIPAVTLINVVQDGEKVTICASNNDAGKQMAEHVRDLLPENATVVFLKGPAGATNSDDRVIGFKENIGRDDLEYLDEQHGDWMMEKGFSIMETWIQAYDQIDLLFSCSDTMTPGAVEALKAAGRLDGTMVISVDGTKEGLNLLKEGAYELDMLYNATTAGTNAVDVFEKIVAGETEIEDIYFPMTPVLQEDVDELMGWYFIGE